MSAITSDWARVETEAPLTRAVERDMVYRREEEFRAALNNYIAAYIAAQQKRRSAANSSIGSAARYGCFTVFRQLLGRRGLERKTAP